MLERARIVTRAIAETIIHPTENKESSDVPHEILSAALRTADYTKSTTVFKATLYGNGWSGIPEGQSIKAAVEQDIAIRLVQNSSKVPAALESHMEILPQAMAGFCYKGYIDGVPDLSATMLLVPSKVEILSEDMLATGIIKENKGMWYLSKAVDPLLAKPKGGIY